MTLTTGSKLGPYEILESIGSGGMGEVWKARDTRLGRVVAIKKVKEQHSERFKQEARSIAALNHPNICQIFDIGDDYLVLEYVEGKPLSSPLPEEEAVQLAIQIASALEEAHQNGIIHRDLKPSNIMVTEKGSMKLLDFGLAKLYEQDASISSLPTADMPATQAGAILGTVAYMSPEQAQGKPADARSDIFSFGLVLYEMLSGERAFSGDSNFAVMEAIVRKDPPPLKTSPPPERIVKRCLEKQPSARYQTMSALKKELEVVLKEMQSKTSTEPQPSIAVLPFVNMSGDQEQEYFSDGLAEEIINALTKIPGLQVIARTSAFAFKGKEQDITEIARALRVSNILEGSVRKFGNRIRVTTQLIEASRGVHLWSERYDRELTDVFAIQDEISHSIADRLSVQFLGDRPLKRRTQNVEAYNLYLKGRFQLQKYTSESLAKSKGYLEQAIALDPDYAPACCGLAELWFWQGLLGYMRPIEANSQCRQAVLKALKLDESLPDAHAMMGILRTSEFDWKGAEREFRQAIELAPDSSFTWWTHSHFYLLPMRRLDEAIEESKRALELDPLHPLLHFHLSQRYQISGQYNRAIEPICNALEIDPQYHFANVLLGWCYACLGRSEEAISACQKALQVPNPDAQTLGIVGGAYAIAGQIDEAQNALEKLQKLSKSNYVPPIAFVWIYATLGETENVFDWLEKAIDEHDALLVTIPPHPLMDPFRSHPRFKDLLRKMNLES